MVLPSVLIIGGVCGSGKSTIGKELAEKIGYTFVDADDFHTEESKAKMGRGEALSDVDRMPWLEKVSEIWANGEKAERFVIACSALKRKYRSFLLDRKQSNDKNKVIIMLLVPEEILRKRTAERSDHFAKSNLIPSQLDDLELAPENGEEFDVLTIDGTRKKDEIVAEIINKTENYSFIDTGSN
ncbi:hypothetical protein niasHS_010892 [Heterodera schachtii]|uniref:Gluconokinase n=1 Tax=Heterodera schachtii TaxID=97005 RepID=A0ABD2IZ02_HETSC